MATTIILAVGVLFLAMGVLALAAPRTAMQQFGIVLDQPAARYEVRAVYGGFGVAMAVVLGYAAATSGGVRTGIVVVAAAALAGMAAGRLISAVVDERTPFFPNWFYAAAEAVCAGLLAVAA